MPLGERPYGAARLPHFFCGVKVVNTAFRDDCEVAVVGAGPYGLSLGAHLKSAGIETRVFGRPEPLPLEDFVRYGDWFQKTALPDLDTRQVKAIEPAGREFWLILADGT